MLKKIVLVACAKTKRPTRSKAKDMCISALFAGNLAYARSLQPDAIFILSAKYGLLDLDTEIEPYDLTLKTMTSAQIKAWADMVMRQLRERTDITNTHVVFLAGMVYRKYLIPHLPSYETPLEGLPIGKQLQFLKRSL